MAKTRFKTFGSLSARLEILADGAKRHQSDEQFPAKFLNEETIRGQRTELEDAREQYEKLLTQAKQAGEAYKESAEKSKKMVSAAQLAVQAAYGKKNIVLQDFGFIPLKNGVKKTSNAAEAA